MVSTVFELEKRIRELEQALPDPAKLEMAAEWFDLVDEVSAKSAELLGKPFKPEPQIQTYLRRQAALVRSALDH